MAEYEEQMETQQDLADEQLEYYEDANVPQQKKSNDIYSLFNWVRLTKNTTKVANLINQELGQLTFSVRDAQWLAHIGQTLKHEEFAKFWVGGGEIISASSLSRKGFFVELFVTSKRFSAKSKGGQEQTKEKWRLLGKKSQSVEQ